MAKRSCSTCDFNLGKECHAHPPVLTRVSGAIGDSPALIQYRSKFPNVAPDSWCGEYKPAEDQIS